MLPDQVSNPGPLTYESGALPIALRGPAVSFNAVFFPRDVLDEILDLIESVLRVFLPSLVPQGSTSA